MFNVKILFQCCAISQMVSAVTWRSEFTKSCI